MDRAKIMNEISAGFNQKYIEQQGMDKSPQLFEQTDKHYPVVKGKSDGREVLNHVPNMESISASLLNYKELPKVRDVPLSDFELSGTSYSASENKRIKDLAEQIRQSNKITPLIVVVDADGPYILEGGHRADALFLLGAKSFPAVVVVDLEDNKDISVGAETFNIIFKTASISDEEYMKAVEAGDIQTCKNMINDAAYAAGYTIQAWHGTRSEDKFTIFHDNHNNKQSQAPIGTYFFSGDSDVAYSYSGHSDKVMNVFLKIENPLCFDFQGADWQGDLYGKFEADNDGVIKYFKTYEKANDWLIQNGVENPDQYIREDPWVGHSTNSVVLEAKQGGYDGVIMDNVLDNGSYSDPSPGTVYAVFSSSQIKSAEPIVYDNSENIIPLSQRFNGSSSDIRFEKDSPIITQANFDIIEKTASFGESTIPEGNIRLYHYTRGKANDLLSNGIKLSYSKGDAYGEPNMIWASSIPMTKDKTVIEFTIPANDPALILEYPKQGENIQQWNSGYHHVGILRDIMPKEILAVHEPWSDLYQEMLNDPEFCSRVMSGEFDYITEDKYPLEYKAIQAVKEYMSHKADNENTNVSLLHDLSGVAPDDVEQDEEPILAKSEFDILMTKTASSDEEYMKAVEAGDIDKIQHMVDEAAKAAGYDFAASHGSANHNITIFDGKRAGEQKTSDWTKHGTYFNPGHNSSQYYADEAFQSNDPELKRLMDEEELAAKAMGTTIMNAWIDRDKIGPENYEKLKKFEQAWRSRIRELETMAESGKGGKVYNAYLRIENPYVYQYVGITDPNAGDYAVSHGYDAVVVINDSYTGDWRSQADEIVVFSPDQIKSAEPVTYDDKGNVIPLSRRFDSSNSDIRFRDTAPVITTANFNITIQSPSISIIVKESSINNSGEIIAYHGTPYKFETFSSEFMESGEDQLGSGFYFTSNKNNARSFAFKDDNIPNQDNAIFKVKLDIKNPLDADKVGTIPRSKIMQLLKSSPNFKEALSNFGDIEYEGEHNVLKQAVDNYYEHCNGNNIVRGLFAVANDFYSRRPQEFNDAVTKILGYDGVIKRFPKDPFYGDLTHYVAFRPEQIQVLERETQTRTSQSNFDVVVKTSQEEDYRGDHQAPDHTSGYPLHDLSGIYPDDIYGENGARYYGQGNPLDSLGVAIIKAYRGRPNAQLQIYRAVPDLKKMDETIEDLEAQKRFILKYGKLPNGVEPRVEKGSQSTKPISKHYDWLCAEIERRKLLPPVEKTKLSINIGDWVTTVREYAKEHGESTLLGKYKILSKTVYARDLFTTGDSIFEFGYDPQPAVPRNRKQASFDAVIKTSGVSLTGYRNSSSSPQGAYGTFYSFEQQSRPTVTKTIYFDNLLEISPDQVAPFEGLPSEYLASKWFASFDFRKAAIDRHMDDGEIMDEMVAIEAARRGYDGIRYGDLEFVDLHNFSPKKERVKSASSNGENSDEDPIEFFRDKTIQAIRETGFSNNILSNGGVLMYHGTSERNAKLILRQGKFNGFPFFSPDRNIAKAFAGQAGKNPTVIDFVIDPSAILPISGSSSNYFSARVSGLMLLKNNIWGYQNSDVGKLVKEEPIKTASFMNHANNIMFNETGKTDFDYAEVTMHRWGKSPEVYIYELRSHVKGGGSKILNQLTQWADDNGFRLIGDARAMSADEGVDALSQENLIKFYKKYGFSVDKNNKFFRNPQSNSRQITASSKDFDSWFAGSKVVDSNGNPLVVHHGTDKNFTVFDKSKTYEGIFWFTSDRNLISSGEIGANGSGNIMDAYLSIKNPAGWDEYDKFSLGQLFAQGYDGAILPEDGQITCFVFEPEQIKLVSEIEQDEEPILAKSEFDILMTKTAFDEQTNSIATGNEAWNRFYEISESGGKWFINPIKLSADKRNRGRPFSTYSDAVRSAESAAEDLAKQMLRDDADRERQDLAASRKTNEAVNEIADLNFQHKWDDSTKVGDLMERVVWDVKRGQDIETNPINLIGVKGKGDIVRGVHIGDSDYWHKRLRKDYGRGRGSVINIVVSNGDRIVEDNQYMTDPDTGEKADSAVLLTARKTLKYGVDWVFANEDFANKTADFDILMTKTASSSDDEYMKAVEDGDMNKAQRMVDEAAQASGYTIKAFHGTPVTGGFTVFREGHEFQRVKGIYFTKKRYLAELYTKRVGRPSSGIVFETYLRINNQATPIDLDTIVGRTLGNAEANRRALILHGFDGFIDDIMDEIVVFSPSQIKSAEAIARDDSGKVVPLSQRFNSSSSDIRFEEDTPIITTAGFKIDIIKTASSDDEYMKAAEAGDIKTCQKMIDTEANDALKDMRDRWRSDGVSSFAYASNGDIKLSEIQMPKSQRGQGLGTQKMQELINFAQRHSMRIILSPSTSFGASSKSRLEHFYSNLGFVKNSGSNKDYRTSETMIWRPNGYERSSDPIMRDSLGEIVPLSKMFTDNIPNVTASVNVLIKTSSSDDEYMTAAKSNDIESCQKMVNEAADEEIENEFNKHYTGFISSNAYKEYEKEGGLSWLGPVEKNPILIAEINGIEYRQSGEKLDYCKVDAEGEIIRGQDGLALMQSDDEIKAQGLPIFDTGVVAYKNGKPIGFAADEFGAVGIWVEKPYQKQGIGKNLLRIHMEQCPNAIIGQMTSAGQNLTKSFFRDKQDRSPILYGQDETVIPLSSRFQKLTNKSITEAKYKFDIITAMSKPSEFIFKANLYHATSDSESGEKILADGFIRPQEHTNKHFLTPVKGMIYSSNSLETAAIYALGGVMMGSDFHESTKSSGQYGYIFMLDAGSMHDVQPDEDSVGEVLSKGLMIYYLDLHHTKLIPNGKAPYWLVNLAFANVAHSRLLKAVNGDYIYYASIGKQLMGKLSDSQKLELIEKYHANVAHNGPVKILKAWRLDKTKSKQISRDGSNVLQIAEEIPVSFGEMKTASFDIITKTASSSDAEYMKAVEAGDLESCQRMINEAANAAGYNVGPVWHGSNNKFTVFDPTKIGSETDSGLVGEGFYFHPDETIADVYGKQKIRAFLRMDKTFDFNNYEESINSIIRERGGRNGWTQWLRDNKYDSVILWKQHMVLSPNQIKSADPIVRNESGDIIPLSKRFDSSSSDIRYKEESPVITTANSKMTNDERTFYRGTVPGETRRIKEPFDAAHGKTFASRKEESARNYGSDIETIVASPNAKILREEDPTFWRLIGRRRPANGYIGSALRNGETVIEAVNDAIRKAEQAGYDIISFSSDTDIGTVILNEASVTRQSKTNSLSSEKNEPSDDLHKDDFQIITIANFNIDLNDKSKKSIENTPGAKITENGLEIEVERNQHRDQAGTPSARSGVFYQPSGSYSKYPYSGQDGYGGLEKIKKTLMLKTPMFVRGATGGKAPQMAYDSIMGKGAYERMRMYILNEIVFKREFRKNIPVENIALILDSYGGDSSLAERIKRIFEHQSGNGLVYAISENIVANVVRKAGYDSIVGYSTRKDGTHFLSEVFNLNEQSYPKKIEQQASYATPNTNEKDKDQSIENYMDYRDEAIMEFLHSFKSHKSSKKWLVPWNLIPAARLIKIWNDYAKLGFVRDEKGMDSIAQQMIKNVARLEVTNSISGHDMIDMREEAEEMYGYKFTDRQWNKFIDGMEDEKGNWRVSDYGLPQLSNLAFKLGMAQTAEQQLIIVDQMLNITHQRGDLAAQFIEGGEKTLNQLFLGGTTEASGEFDKIGSDFNIVIESKLNLETGVDDAKAKGHLDTQLFPNCAGTKFDRDIVKKHLRRQKNLLRKKHLASENMSPEEIEKIQNDLIDEFNAEYDRKWTEVKSSAIRAVSFDEANGKLEVMMKNFKVYSFMHVSKTDFDEFLLSQSKGKWLVNFIAKRKQSKNQKTATVKWGTAGSGVLYYCQEDQTILLLKRSLDVLDPNMWGIPGGAVKGTEGFVDNLEKAPDFDEETLRSSADKEVEEEIGHLPDGPTLIKSVTIQFGSFKYTTFLMGVTLEQKNNITTNSQLNWESTKLEWFNLTNLPKNLHPGVKSAIEKLF